MNSSEDEGENLENLACSVVKTSISAAKKKPTPVGEDQYRSMRALPILSPTNDNPIAHALIYQTVRRVNSLALMTKDRRSRTQ